MPFVYCEMLHKCFLFSNFVFLLVLFLNFSLSNLNNVAQFQLFHFTKDLNENN